MVQVATRALAVGDIAAMARSWQGDLRAAGKSGATRATYLKAVELLAEFLDHEGMPSNVAELTGEHVREFMAHLLEVGKASSAGTRFRGLQAFFIWLVAEGEIAANPMKRMKSPKPEQHDAHVLTHAEIKAILATCDDGTDFESRRDAALIRLMIDCGARRAEVADLLAEDVDLEHGEVFIRQGKGAKDRYVSIGDKTARALRRYLRKREGHPRHKDAALWLGHRGAMGVSGVAYAVRRRGQQAGVEVHPHSFRHSFAHNWLADGGGETSLMRIAGWRSGEMIKRYAASTATERAIAEHKKVSLSDKF